MANQQLLDYVQQQKATGITDEVLTKKLIETGWPQPEIDMVFSELKVSETPAKPAEVSHTPSMGDGTWLSASDVGAVVSAGQPPTTITKPAPVEEPQTVPEVSAVSRPKEKSKNWIWILILLASAILVGVAVFVMVNQTRQESAAEMILPAPTSTAEMQVVPTDIPVTVTYTGNGFSIVPPIRWAVDESGSSGTLVLFSNPVADDDQGNRLVASINVVTEEAKQTDIKKYLATSKESLAKLFEEYTVVSEKSAGDSTGSGMLLEASYQMGVYKLHNLQLLQIVGDKAYVVTATALDSKWADYAAMFNETLASFKVQ